MKILIRLPNWLGDAVMSTAFVAAVREFYADAKIDVIVKKELNSIASLFPGVNKVYPFSKSEFSGLPGVFRFGKGLRKENYDIYFNLPGSLSSLMMAWATRAKKRVGFGSEGGFFLLTNICKRLTGLNRVEEYLSLLEQFTGKPAGKVIVSLKVKEPVSRNSNRMLINFNSEAESRRMPVDKGRRIINTLTNTFPDKIFMLIGSQKETAFVDSVIKGAANQERIENCAGKTNLIDLCDLIAGSAAMVTTDSGPAHLANSLGIPVIVLFGAGNEHNTAPYNKDKLTVLRYGKLTCEPCVKNTCRLYGIPKCMEMLDELQIVSELSAVLDI